MENGHLKLTMVNIWLDVIIVFLGAPKLILLLHKFLIQMTHGLNGLLRRLHENIFYF